MQRVAITVDDDPVAEIDAHMALHGYLNRSGTIRHLARTGLHQLPSELVEGRDCVATLSYLYDSSSRETLKHLSRDFGAQHGLLRATMRIRVDCDTFFEVVVLKGSIAEVKGFADRVISDCGVRYGSVVCKPVDWTG